ncbi:MAG: class I SAM-dependent methyltransferase [bacterium]
MGVDISTEMLAQAERRRSTLPLKLRDHLELHQADMRDFDLGRTFPLITCPFNAFQHLYTRDDVARCLAMVRRHLAPGAPSSSTCSCPIWSTCPARRCGGTRAAASATRATTPGTPTPSAAPTTRCSRSTRCGFGWCATPARTGGRGDHLPALPPGLLPQEMEAHLHAAGLRLVEFQGDFHGAPLGKDAESMVVIAGLA